MSLYELFKNSKPTEKTKFAKIYYLKDNDNKYKIILIKRRANRRSIIHCTDNLIEWEQFPLLPRIWGGRLANKTAVYKVEKPKNETVIFVIKGNPNGVTGLDDGLFRSVKKFDKNYINIMALKYFKTGDFIK